MGLGGTAGSVGGGGGYGGGMGGTFQTMAGGYGPRGIRQAGVQPGDVDSLGRVFDPRYGFVRSGAGGGGAGGGGGMGGGDPIASALEFALSGTPAHDISHERTAQYFKEAVSKPMLQEFERSIKPRIMEAYSARGGLWSSRRSEALSKAAMDIENTLSSQLAGVQISQENMRATLADSARNRQMQTAASLLSQALGYTGQTQMMAWAQQPSARIGDVQRLRETLGFGGRSNSTVEALLSPVAQLEAPGAEMESPAGKVLAEPESEKSYVSPELDRVMMEKAGGSPTTFDPFGVFNLSGGSSPDEGSLEEEHAPPYWYGASSGMKKRRK